VQDFYEVQYYTFLGVRNDNAEYLPMRLDILFNHMPCGGNPANIQQSPFNSMMNWNTSKATWNKNLTSTASPKVPKVNSYSIPETATACAKETD
jgi:hypothetical protein